MVTLATTAAENGASVHGDRAKISAMSITMLRRFRISKSVNNWELWEFRVARRNAELSPPRVIFRSNLRQHRGSVTFNRRYSSIPQAIGAALHDSDLVVEAFDSAGPTTKGLVLADGYLSATPEFKLNRPGCGTARPVVWEGGERKLTAYPML
jgi:hypothetical protein